MALKQYLGSPDLFDQNGVYQKTVDFASNPQIDKINTTRPDVTSEADFGKVAGTNIAAPITKPFGVDFNGTVDSGAFVNPVSNGDIEKKLADYKASLLPTTPAPVAPNMANTYTGLLQSNGINDLNTALAAKNAEIQAHVDATKVANDAVGNQNKDMQMGAVRGEQNVLRQQAQDKLDSLNREKSLMVDELTTKQNVVSNIMSFTQSDYTTAVDQYNTSFSQNLSFQTAMQNYKDKTEATANAQRDDARANLTTLTNLVKDSGKSWDNVDSQMKLNIQTLENKAGLPLGTIEEFSRALPKANLLSTTNGTDAQGNAITSFIYADENGNPGVVKVVKTGGYEAPKVTTPSKTTPGNDNQPVDINKLSSTAQAVLNGTIRLEDLTATEKGKIAGELNAAGYKSTPKLSATQQDEIATMATVEDLMNKVKAYNSDGKLEGIGGFWQGTLGGLSTQYFGTGSEEAKNVRALISNAKGTIAKLRGGTSFTPNEQKMLENYTPTIDESAASVLSKIDMLTYAIDKKRTELLNAAQDRKLPSQNNTEDLRTKYNY